MDSKISSFTISNGLTVIHTRRPNSLNVSMSLMVIAGSMYESSEEIGVAHFLEHIVSDGTEKYPTEKRLAELIDERGGARNAITNKETIEYVVKVLKEDSEIAFEYLSEISIHPLIRDEDVQKQKKIIEQEIYRFKSDPEKFAQRLIYSAIFPDTRIGGLTTGDVDDVKRISQSNILSYHYRTHCAKNMVLSVCGNISEEAVLVLARKYFGDLTSGEKLSPIDLHVVPKNEPMLQIMPDLKQAILAVGYQGFRSGDKDHYVADILSVLLTRGKSSRLFYEIREKRALAYMVNSNNFNGRNIGVFTIQVGLANDKVSECLEIIKTELKKVTSSDLPEVELNKALAFIRSNIAFSFENSLFEASYYSRLWCFTGIVQPIERELDYYESIIHTPSLIQETAKKMFSVNPAVLIIGQGTAQESQIRTNP